MRLQRALGRALSIPGRAAALRSRYQDFIREKGMLRYSIEIIGWLAAAMMLSAYLLLIT